MGTVTLPAESSRVMVSLLDPQLMMMRVPSEEVLMVVFPEESVAMMELEEVGCSVRLPVGVTVISERAG